MAVHYCEMVPQAVCTSYTEPEDEDGTTVWMKSNYAPAVRYHDVRPEVFRFVELLPSSCLPHQNLMESACYVIIVMKYVAFFLTYLPSNAPT